jgi:hypothetical protein
MRKPNNAADKHEQYGELGIHQSASFKSRQTCRRLPNCKNHSKVKDGVILGISAPVTQNILHGTKI